MQTAELLRLPAKLARERKRRKNARQRCTEMAENGLRCFWRRCFRLSAERPLNAAQQNDYHYTAAAAQGEAQVRAAPATELVFIFMWQARYKLFVKSLNALKRHFFCALFCNSAFVQLWLESTLIAFR